MCRCNSSTAAKTAEGSLLWSKRLRQILKMTLDMGLFQGVPESNGGSAFSYRPWLGESPCKSAISGQLHRARAPKLSLVDSPIFVPNRRFSRFFMAEMWLNGSTVGPLGIRFLYWDQEKDRKPQMDHSFFEVFLGWMMNIAISFHLWILSDLKSYFRFFFQRGLSQLPETSQFLPWLFSKEVAIKISSRCHIFMFPFLSPWNSWSKRSSRKSRESRLFQKTQLWVYPM